MHVIDSLKLEQNRLVALFQQHTGTLPPGVCDESGVVSVAGQGGAQDKVERSNKPDSTGDVGAVEGQEQREGSSGGGAQADDVPEVDELHGDDPMEGDGDGEGPIQKKKKRIS